MSTFILIVFVLPVLFVRDCVLLQIGPIAAAAFRLRVYAVGLLTSLTLFSVLTLSLHTDQLLQTVRLPTVTVPAALLYGVLLAACVWVRHTDRHQFAWWIAILPNPVLVGAFAVLARLFLSQAPMFATALGAALMACVWIGLISLWVWSARKTPLDVSDVNFSVSFATLVNSAAIVLLPFAAVLLD